MRSFHCDQAKYETARGGWQLLLRVGPAARCEAAAARPLRRLPAGAALGSRSRAPPASERTSPPSPTLSAAASVATLEMAAAAAAARSPSSSANSSPQLGRTFPDAVYIMQASRRGRLVRHEPQLVTRTGWHAKRLRALFLFYFYFLVPIIIHDF